MAGTSGILRSGRNLDTCQKDLGHPGSVFLCLQQLPAVFGPIKLKPNEGMAATRRQCSHGTGLAHICWVTAQSKLQAERGGRSNTEAGRKTILHSMAKATCCPGGGKATQESGVSDVFLGTSVNRASNGTATAATPLSLSRCLIPRREFLAIVSDP